MARANNGFGKDETDVMNDTAEIEDRDTPLFVTSAKLAGMIGTRPLNFIRASGQTAAPTGRTYYPKPQPVHSGKNHLPIGAVL
jgi:hypothetical protein